MKEFNMFLEPWTWCKECDKPNGSPHDKNNMFCKYCKKPVTLVHGTVGDSNVRYHWYELEFVDET